MNNTKDMDVLFICAFDFLECPTLGGEWKGRRGEWHKPFFLQNQRTVIIGFFLAAGFIAGLLIWCFR